MGVTDIFLPQLLATVKLPKDFDIIGSAVNVYNTTNGFNRGLALDAALRIPLPDSFTPSIIKKQNCLWVDFEPLEKPLGTPLIVWILSFRLCPSSSDEIYGSITRWFVKWTALFGDAFPNYKMGPFPRTLLNLF